MGTNTDFNTDDIEKIKRMYGCDKQCKNFSPFKPVAAGAEPVDGQLQNDDALALIEAAGGAWDYRDVNPYCFEAPVSPHLASAGQGVELARIEQSARRLAAQSDCLVVEGAGGWLVPLGGDLDIADLAQRLDLPVILVVGLRLGCLNHARLSEFAVQRSGVRLGGWIASQVDPHMACVEENLQTLRDKLHSPCLGVLPWQQAAELDAESLRALAEK